MYLPYLMIGYAGAILLGLVGCRIADRALPGLPGVRLLSWGLAVVLVGMVLFGLRPVTPLWVTSVVANETILAYSVLLYAGLAQCLGVRSRVAWWGTGLIVLQLSANIYFTFDQPSLTSRFVVTAFVPSVCSAAAATILFRYRVGPTQVGASGSAALRYLVKAMAWLQVVDVASATLRIALTEARPSSQVVELDLIQSTFTYFNLLYGLGSAVGLLWLAFMIHREDLYARAQTDGLTGLLNRGALDELLARELRRARAEQRSLTVMLADIDHFKRINDGWGHPAGDEALRQVSGALRRILRPSDTLARFGGEEFAIIVRDSSLPNAKDVAERLRAEVALLSGLPGDQQITISIGLASSVPGERPESVIERCDQALYRSKREGRNRVSVAANPEDEEPAGLPPSSGIVQSRETRTSG